MIVDEPFVLQSGRDDTVSSIERTTFFVIVRVDVEELVDRSVRRRNSRKSAYPKNETGVSTRTENTPSENQCASEGEESGVPARAVRKAVSFINPTGAPIPPDEQSKV